MTHIPAVRQKICQSLLLPLLLLVKVYAFVAPQSLSAHARIASPLHVLPLDVNAVRVLSGVAAGDQRIAGGVIESAGGVVESATSVLGWTIGGIFLLFVLTIAAMAPVAQAATEKATEEFLKKLQDDHPEKLKEFEEKKIEYTANFEDSDSEAVKIFFVAFMEDPEFAQKTLGEVQGSAVLDSVRDLFKDDKAALDAFDEAMRNAEEDTGTENEKDDSKQ